MDPLSITAGIVAVFQATSTLLAVLNRIRDATKEQQQIAIELCHLQWLLQKVRYRIDQAQSNEAWSTRMVHFAAESSLLNDFEKALQDMTKKLEKNSKFGRLTEVLPHKAQEEVNLLNRLERFKSLLALVMADDHFELSQAIHTKVTALEQDAKDEVHTAIAQWLRVDDPSYSYRTALGKRQQGTGSWLLHNEKYLEWKSNADSLLWLYGKPGCGKTVLCTTAVEDSLQYSRSTTNISVSYFYFEFNDSRKKSVRSCMYSLVYQLSRSAATDALHLLYDACEKGKRQPQDHEVKDVLRTYLQEHQENYVILDALDESHDRCEIFTNLLKLLTKGNRLHILVTSRPEKDIQEGLAEFAAVSIDLKSDLVDEDISTYVEDKLRQDVKLSKFSSEIRQEIKTSLLAKADGMFRWIFCQIEALRLCFSVKKLRVALSTLPTTLDETYERILSQIETNGHMIEALRVLQFLCSSERSVTLNEIVDFLAIDPTDQLTFDPDGLLEDPHDLSTICSSLITVTEEPASSYTGCPKSHFRVQLAHFSVQEYLLSERNNFKEYFGTHRRHRLVLQSCLTYLNYLGQIDDGKNVVRSEDLDPPCCQHPFTRYAVSYWPAHANKFTEDESLPTSVDLSIAFLRNEQNLLTWLRISEIDFVPPVTTSDLASILYYAVLTEIPALVETLIKNGEDVNAVGGFSHTPLLAAVCARKEKIAHILVENGANVNDRGNADWGYLTPLAVVSGSGDIETVGMLIEHGALVDAQDETFGFALMAASSYGYDDIVDLLLRHGADINLESGWTECLRGSNGEIFYTRCGDTINALDAALLGDHRKTSMMLLEHGADHTTETTRFGSVLGAACARGFEDVVELLLGRTVDVNTDEYKMGTPLVFAAAFGREDLVRILLKHGVDVNVLTEARGLQKPSAGDTNHAFFYNLQRAQHDTGYTPGTGTALQAALTNGHVQIAWLLIEAGAATDTPAGRWGTPLQEAASHGSIDLVSHLLLHGADVNAGAGEQYFLQLPGLALTAAAGKGHDVIVKSLIDHGANVDAHPDIGFKELQYTALEAAVRNGQKSTVSILLERGANANIMCTKDGCAVHDIGQIEGCHEIIELLRRNGAVCAQESGCQQLWKQIPQVLVARSTEPSN